MQNTANTANTAARSSKSMRCILTIVDMDVSDELSEFLDELNIQVFWLTRASGTANSDFLNLWGLGDTHKSICICFIAAEFRHTFMSELNQALRLHRRGTGIAVSFPIRFIQGWMFKLVTAQTACSAGQDISYDQSETANMNEVMNMNEKMTHTMILVSVKQGFCDDVMKTARAAGAAGGTIIKGLRTLSDSASNHYGLAAHDEIEIIAIVAERDRSPEIMSAISAQHGISSPAHGAVLSLPVDEIIGL